MAPPSRHGGVGRAQGEDLDVRDVPRLGGGHDTVHVVVDEQFTPVPAMVVDGVTKLKVVPAVTPKPPRPNSCPS